MTTVTSASLCKGYGGLDMAIAEMLPTHELWCCEHEPATASNPKPTDAAARLIAHHYPGLPNHGDITTVDWANLEPVDLIGAGFPCQDVSPAGLRAGLVAGSRSGLWLHIATGISVLRPALVVLENVRGILSATTDRHLEPCPGCLGDRADQPAMRALGAVLGDLADLGYDAVWCGIRASDVGAPHSRYRIIIAAADPSHSRLGAILNAVRPRQPHAAGLTLADPTGQGRGLGEPDHVAVDGCPPLRTGQAQPGRRDSAAAADAGCDTRPQDHPHGAAAGRGCGTAADTDGDGLPRRPERDGDPQRPQTHDADQRVDPAGRILEWAQYTPAIRRWEHILGRPAPTPTVDGRRGGRRLNPQFSEWMMGLPDGWVTDVPDLTITEQLHIIGNGVVPRQGSAALRYLLPLLAREVLAA